MRVLHVTNLYPYQEAKTFGIFVKEQISSLQDDNLQEVYFINARKLGIRAYFYAFFDLRKIISKYDLVHCHHQFSTVSTVFATSRVPIVTSILGDIKKRNWINKLAFHFAKNLSDVVIMKNGLPTKNGPKFLLVPNGVNLNQFKPIEKDYCRTRLNLDKDKHYVLFVSNGNLSNPIKRYDKFLKVIEALNSDGTQQRYVPLHLNQVERGEVPIFYNAADFMLLTSDHEGSPNAVKEAMACNLPIVATPVGDVPILLHGVSNSFVAESHSTSELLNLAKRIILGNRSNGRDRLIDLHLDTENIANKLKNIYQSVHKTKER